MPSDGRVSNALGVPLPQWIIKQLDKRSLELSVPQKDIPTNDNLLYRGNRSSWVRVVSSVDLVSADKKKSTVADPVQYFSKTIGLSGITDKSDLAKKFILQGGVSKYTKINDNSFSYTPLGGINESYNVAGEQEIKEYGYRPMPGITSVRVQTQGKLGSIRSAEIQLKVWDKTQLDIIDALYFKLGYSLFLEWGHTTFYKAGSDKLEWGEDFSIDPFSDSNSTKEDIQNQIAVNSRNSEGNYDAMLGIITNFNFTYNQEGGYDCSIKVISLGVLISSTKMNNPRILPDLQDAIVKKLFNRLIQLRKQELIDAQNKLEDEKKDPSRSPEAYPACVRNRGKIEQVIDRGEYKRLYDWAILAEVSNNFYFFYPNGRYQTSGLKAQGFYTCDGDKLLLDGDAKDFIPKKYVELLESGVVSDDYLGYKEPNIPVPSVTSLNYANDIVRGIYFESGIASAKKSGEYLAFNNFKQFLPTFNTAGYSAKASIQLPTIAYNDVRLVQNTQTLTLENVIFPQKISITDLLLRDKTRSGKGKSVTTPITISSNKNLTLEVTYTPENIFDNSGSPYANTYESRVTYKYPTINDSPYANLYTNTFGKFTLPDILNFRISLQYDGFATPPEGKSYAPEYISTFFGEYSKYFQEEIKNQISGETKDWIITTIGSVKKGSVIISLEKNLSVKINVLVPPVDANGARVMNAPKTDNEDIVYSFNIRLIIENDVNIIKSLSIPKNQDLVIAGDAINLEQRQQDQQNIPQEATPESEINVSDIQKSEALKYRSAFEVMIRTIQLYSLNEAIETGGIENDRRPKQLNLLAKNNYDSFTKKLFSNGLFTPVLDNLQQFAVSGSNKETYIKDFNNYDIYANSANSQDETKKLLVRSLFGFNFGLMGNKKDSVGIAQELYDKDLLVNYNNLFTTCTVPYQFNTGVFEGTQVNHPVYVPFGLVLMILNHACLIYDSTDDKSNKKSTSPMFYIDFNNKTNLCLTSPKQISTNPYDVIIPIQASDSDFASIIEPTVLTSKNKIKAPKEGEQKETAIFSPQKDDLLSYALPEFRDTQNKIDNYRGRTMNILISCDYLLRVVESYSKANNSGDVYVKEFIEQILFDVNKSLGDFNIFRLAYDDGANTAHVVDDQLSPNLEGNYITSENKSKLPLFGKASIAKSLEIRTEISSKLSNMLAVSANAQIENTSNLSKNADSYGFYNASYKDRYIPNRTEINNGNKESLPTDTMINSAIQFNNAISTFYGSATPAIDSVGHATNYYIQRMSKLKSEDKGTRSSVMIPVSLNFSIDGISGVGMGHAFTIPEEFLPYTYNLSLTDPYGNADAVNTVGFVTVGLDQTIENNQWTSNFRCNMMYLKKMDDFTAKDMLNKLKDNPGSFIEAIDSSGNVTSENADFISKTPWSAAFISYVMKKAGVTFGSAASHTQYLNNIKQYSNWKILDPEETQIQVGDLVVQNRDGNNQKFSNSPYSGFSHGDIIVEISGNIAYGIGGNVSDTVYKSSIDLRGGKLGENFFAIARESRQSDIDNYVRTAITEYTLWNTNAWKELTASAKPKLSEYYSTVGLKLV